jgi:hypothetical protein
MSHNVVPEVFLVSGGLIVVYVIDIRLKLLNLRVGEINPSSFSLSAKATQSFLQVENLEIIRKNTLHFTACVSLAEGISYISLDILTSNYSFLSEILFSNLFLPALDGICVGYLPLKQALQKPL